MSGQQNISFRRHTHTRQLRRIDALRPQVQAWNHSAKAQPRSVKSFGRPFYVLLDSAHPSQFGFGITYVLGSRVSPN